MEQDRRAIVRIVEMGVSVEGYHTDMYAIELECPEIAVGKSIVACYNPRFKPFSEIQEEAKRIAHHVSTLLDFIKKKDMITIDKKQIN